MIRPFLILGLPRSRTAWLARFLTYREWFCGHEELRHMRSVDDARAWLSQPFTGSAETAAAPFWRILQKIAPETRIVLVRRPLFEVTASLGRVAMFDPVAMTKVLARANAKLDQIRARWPHVMEVTFADLAHEASCAKVFEFCLPYSHDPLWWRACDAVNVQCHFPAHLRHMEAFLPQINKAASIAKQIMLGDLSRRERQSLDGLEIKLESFETFYRDCQGLFSEHLALVGQDPNAFQDKHLPFLNFLDQNGAMQILVARSNGRPFGYLMSEISPSREKVGEVIATHTRFYASPDMPGVGARLQREAVKMLRARGVSEVWGFTGALGDGPRLGIAYKRQGFEEIGMAHRLRIN